MDDSDFTPFLASQDAGADAGQRRRAKTFNDPVHGELIAIATGPCQPHARSRWFCYLMYVWLLLQCASAEGPAAHPSLPPTHLSTSSRNRPHHAAPRQRRDRGHSRVPEAPSPETVGIDVLCETLWCSHAVDASCACWRSEASQRTRCLCCLQIQPTALTAQLRTSSNRHEAASYPAHIAYDACARADLSRSKPQPL